MVVLFAALCLAAAGIMLYDSNRFVTVSYQVADRRIRRHMRLVLLADLHNKQYGKNNEKLLAAIEEAKPDGIVSVGDLIVSEPGESMEPAKRLVRQLSAKYPFYYANGNHEWRIYQDTDKFGSMGEAYRTFLRECKVTLLENETVQLPDCGLALCGLDLPKRFYRKGRKRPMPEGTLEDMLGKPDAARFTILLAHNPVYFEAYADWGADLVLAGHVHGGVVRLPFLGGVISTAFTLFPKYDGGLFEKGTKRMILSRGLGSHTIPVRLFNPGELVVLDLVGEEAAEEKRDESIWRCR